MMRKVTDHTPSEHVSALLARAEDRDKNVRTAIAVALGGLGGDERERRTIVDALTSPTWRVRFAATRAVAMWPAMHAPVERLPRLLADPVPSVRWAAVGAAAKHEGGRLVAPVALSDSAPTVRAAAVLTFLEVKGPDAIRIGVRALEDPDERVRLAAALLLRYRGDPSARNALLAALDDRFMWIRAAAVEGLSRIGGPEVVEPIIGRLSDRKRWVRMEAAHALGSLGDPRAIEPLLSLLERSSSAFAKGAAAVGLGHLGDQRAVEPLAIALRHVWTENPTRGSGLHELPLRPDFELRRGATKALLRIGGPAAKAALAPLPRTWIAEVRKANLP